jgi:acyl-ACP thioesterase
MMGKRKIREILTGAAGFDKNHDMYRVDQRVAASHTNAEGELKLVSAIDMIQDCSQLWLESEPEVERYFRERRIVQVLVFRQADMGKMPLYGERLRVETGIYGCKSFLGYRNTVIYNEKGEPCVTSWSIGAFVNLETGRPEKLPPDLTAGLRLDPKIEMEYLGKKIPAPEEPGERLPPLRAGRNDIDFNRHMNNARYVQIAVELLPPDFAVSRFRIEYKNPAKYGDYLYPERVAREGEGGRGVFLRLSDGGGRPYAVMEFNSR